MSKLDQEIIKGLEKDKERYFKNHLTSVVYSTALTIGGYVASRFINNEEVAEYILNGSWLTGLGVSLTSLGLFSYKTTQALERQDSLNPKVQKDKNDFSSRMGRLEMAIYAAEEKAA